MKSDARKGRKEDDVITSSASVQSLFSLDLLKKVLRDEAHAILYAADHFPPHVHDLIQLVCSTTGKVVFSGIGKSGIAAKKLAATWSSLGIPAFFLHPTDALHGDCGVIQQQDCLIVLSKSGTGSEFEYLLSAVRSRGIKTALLCCNLGMLASMADMVIVLPFQQEACTLNLAPTSSSTLMIAFGDALAVAISSAKGFTQQEYARYHPAGALGRRLLITVRSLMHHETDLPFVTPDASFKDVLVTVTSKKLGVGIVVDNTGKLKGIITDGDLRRACEEKGAAVFEATAMELATKSPKTTEPEKLAYDALEMMESFNITALLVVQHERVVGLVHIHDLIKAGIGG